MKCLNAAKTWTVTKADRQKLEAFKMWTWRTMERISWADKVTNENVLRKVNEDSKY